MSAVAKLYGVGDTVYVWYNGTITNYFTPVARTVSAVKVNTSGNYAVVEFSDGETIIDGAIPTVFTTQLLCAIAITDAVIVASAATAILDTTNTSVASTIAQATTGLGRVD